MQTEDNAVHLILNVLLQQLDPFTTPARLLALDRDCPLLESGRLEWLVHDITYLLRYAVWSTCACVYG